MYQFCALPPGTGVRVNSSLYPKTILSAPRPDRYAGYVPRYDASQFGLPNDFVWDDEIYAVVHYPKQEK